MQINQSCRLFLTNVYSYDISKAHLSIMEKIGLETEWLEKLPKVERNIRIGLLTKDNPRLLTFLRSFVIKTIDLYLLKNDLVNDDIITRQYDGFLSTKSLDIVDHAIPLDLRETYTKFIIASNRQWYIAINGENKVTVKGVPELYDNAVKIYTELLNINYINKRVIFQTLDRIKHQIFNSEGEFYAIPIKKSDKYKIKTIEYGELVLSGKLINDLESDDIDKQWYFQKYFQPIFESICIEHL